jgi:sodium-coupled monocarboxylate transporter 8/12
MTFGVVLTPIVAAYLTGPMFHRLELMSVFEYLKIRYNSNFIRLFATSFYLIRATISTAIYMYGPATTITLLTSLNTTASILIIGSVATFYTTIGGIKAVIWTDFFQMIVMISGVIVIIVKGLYDLGGIERMWQINAAGGRLNFFDFNPNPFVRNSFWVLIVGNFFQFFMLYCIDQSMLQRFASAKNTKHAKVGLLLNVPGIIIFMSVCYFSGLILYAQYAKCDPLSAPLITNVKNQNQLIVYLVTDKMQSLIGFTGLFLSSIVSGSLSSVSSILNSMAAIVWVDFFKPIKCFRKFDDGKSTMVVKSLVVVIGAVATGLAILISNVESKFLASCVFCSPF